MYGLAGRLALLFAASLAPVACVVWPQGAGPDAAPMPAVEALERRDRGEAVLIDVRSPQAYAEGHVPAALNIPSNEIEERAAEIRKMGRLPILYCG
jgi:hypothetical protein